MQLKTYSFIDFGLKDFLRENNGSVIKMWFNDWHEAEEWLLSNGKTFGWTNEGVRYWCWEEEFG